MKILVVLGHPRRESLCGGIFDAYVKRLVANGTEFRELHLSEMRFDLNVRRESILDQELAPDLAKARRDIEWADHLTFVYPVWWGTMPALLKGFLDRILLPGFAFAEREHGQGFIGLLHGKSAQLLTTMDTPPWVVKWILRSPGHRAMRLAVLGFCGVRPIRVKMFGPVIHSSDDQRREWLAISAAEADLVDGPHLEGREARRARLAAWLKALRLQFYPMTWMAYTLGAMVALPGMNIWQRPEYWWGYATLFLIEIITVFLNDLNDVETDRLNQNYSPFTGGSRVIVEEDLTPSHLEWGILAAGSLAMISTFALISTSAGEWWPIMACVMAALILGIGYTTPPLRLCYHGLGELTVALTHSFLIITCGLAFMGGELVPATIWTLGAPIFMSVFAAIALAGIPDREADLHAGKSSLAVRMGSRTVIDIAILATVAAAALAFLLNPQLPLLVKLGIVTHGSVLAGALFRRRGGDSLDRIDALLVASLTYILWFTAGPLFQHWR